MLSHTELNSCQGTPFPVSRTAATCRGAGRGGWLACYAALCCPAVRPATHTPGCSAGSCRARGWPGQQAARPRAAQAAASRLEGRGLAVCWVGVCMAPGWVGGGGGGQDAARSSTAGSNESRTPTAPFGRPAPCLHIAPLRADVGRDVAPLLATSRGRPNHHGPSHSDPTTAGQSHSTGQATGWRGSQMRRCVQQPSEICSRLSAILRGTRHLRRAGGGSKEG